MEAKYKKFLEFSWQESPEWQLYLSNLSETPPPSKILHFKKRFYKLKIDDDFDVKYTPPAEPAQNSNTTNTNRNNNYNSYPNYQPSNLAGLQHPLLAIIESLLWLSFLTFALLGVSYTLKVVCLALLIRVIRRTGLPKLNMEFAQALFLDEHFQLLLYGLLLMIDRVNLFTLVPLGITAILNLSEFIKNRANNLFKPIKPFAEIVFNKRVELALIRAKVEIGIGFLLIIGVFFGINSFVLPVFLWQYLRFKYIVNNDVKLAFAGLNYYVNSFKNNPKVPSPVKFVLGKVQDLASYLGRTEAENGQAAGGANCMIF